MNPSENWSFVLIFNGENRFYVSRKSICILYNFQQFIEILSNSWHVSSREAPSSHLFSTSYYTFTSYLDVFVCAFRFSTTGREGGGGDFMGGPGGGDGWKIGKQRPEDGASYNKVTTCEYAKNNTRAAPLLKFISHPSHQSPKLLLLL